MAPDSLPTTHANSAGPNLPSAEVRPAGILSGRTNPWLVFLLPFAVYLVFNSLEPVPPVAGAASTPLIGPAIAYRFYPIIYTLKIIATLGCMAFVYPGYRQFPRRISLLAILIGVAGTVAWIALAWLQRSAQQHFGWSLGIGERSGFNPLSELAESPPAWKYGFLAIRFFGLAVIVPVSEEFFLRGFLMRFFIVPDWWAVPIGTVNRMAIIAATVVPVLMHPGEAIAAAVWFSGVTWLIIRTRNIWDCVAAHAVTNLLLGIFVVASGNWWLM